MVDLPGAICGLGARQLPGDFARETLGKLTKLTLVEYADGKFNPDKQEQGEHRTNADDFAASLEL